MEHNTLYRSAQRPLRLFALLALLLFGLAGLRPPSVALAACGDAVTTVTNAAQFNAAIANFNAQSSACDFTIRLGAEIDLTGSTTTINKYFQHATLTIEGNGFAIDGQNLAGVRPLTVGPWSGVTLKQVTITGGNHQANGGGIHNAGFLTLIDSIVRDNRVTPVSETGYGGGIYNQGELSLIRSTVRDNRIEGNEFHHQEDGLGGGIYNRGYLLIRDSSITGNGASFHYVLKGGGIYAGDWIALELFRVGLMIINSTISGNSLTSDDTTETSDGAGLYVEASACCAQDAAVPVMLINTTVTNNFKMESSSRTGSGASFHKDVNNRDLVVTIHNSILAGGFGSPSADCWLTGTQAPAFTSLNSLYGNRDTYACGLTATGTDNHDPSGNYVGVGDPKLSPLADNGGPTQTHLPIFFFSRAINTGANHLAVDENNKPLITDQRGYLIRAIDGRVDMGAVELGARTCPTFPVDANDQDDLNVAILCYNGLATPGDYTINLTDDIDLTASTYTIDNATPDVTLTIEGGGFAINGSSTTLVRPLAVAANTVVTLQQVVISGGRVSGIGGGIHNAGDLTLIRSIVRDNRAETIGFVNAYGGGIYNAGDLTLIRSIVRDNRAGPLPHDGAYGGGIYNRGYLLIRDSSITANSASGVYSAKGGGIYAGDWIDEGQGSAGLMIINSTISGNHAQGENILLGGGLHVEHSQSFPVPVTLVNATVTNNLTRLNGVTTGSGVYFSGNNSPNLSVTIHNTILAGNNTGATPGEDCQFVGVSSFTSRNSLYGNSGAGACGLAAANTDPDGNGNYVGVDPKLGPLADNGGPTLTHLPADDSLAVNAGDDDLAVDEDGDPLADDQRGAGFPRRVGGAVDIGAVETAVEPEDDAIYMSATASGTTTDGLAFDNSDILLWDGTEWSLAFDGSAALLTPNNKSKHNTNAFWIGDGEIIMAFAQNGRKVPGITPKVDGTDLVLWDGSGFSFWFDGSDVGLSKKTAEKIDGLHVLMGDDIPDEAGDGCIAFLLVSTQGPGAVPAYPTGQIKFGGEDVLGFCATNLGEATDGFWQMVLDGSAEGVEKNAIDSISLSTDGETLYLTTKAAFILDDAAGDHSMVYAYDIATGAFSGPVFKAADNGLPQKVDGLQMD